MIKHRNFFFNNIPIDVLLNKTINCLIINGHHDFFNPIIFHHNVTSQNHDRSVITKTRIRRYTKIRHQMVNLTQERFIIKRCQIIVNVLCVVLFPNDFHFPSKQTPQREETNKHQKQGLRNTTIIMEKALILAMKISCHLPKPLNQKTKNNNNSHRSHNRALLINLTRLRSNRFLTSCFRF